MKRSSAQLYLLPLLLLLLDLGELLGLDLVGDLGLLLRRLRRQVRAREPAARQISPLLRVGTSLNELSQPVSYIFELPLHYT